MKPSERIRLSTAEFLRRYAPIERDISDAELHEVRAFMRMVLEYLDEEHDRRVQWEAETERQLRSKPDYEQGYSR